MAAASSSSPAGPPTRAATPRSRPKKANSKRPKSGARPAELIEIPDYISPIAVIYNLPGVEELQLDPETLAKIFNQEITSWNDKAIAADNPGVDLPDTRITPVNRSDESGTTENFVEYLSEVVPSVWSYEVSGDWPVKGGEAASGTSGVVEAVTAGEGAIGYADASQAGELGVAKIKVGDEYVEPTPEAAAKMLEESPLDKELSPGKYMFAFELDRKTEAEGTYPIVLTSYLIACTKYDSAEEAARSRRYLEYVDQPRRAGSGRRKRRLGSALPGADREKIDPGRSKRSKPARRDVAQVDTTTNAGQMLAAASGGRRRLGDRIFSRTAVVAGGDDPGPAGRGRDLPPRRGAAGAHRRRLRAARRQEPPRLRRPARLRHRARRGHRRRPRRPAGDRRRRSSSPTSRRRGSRRRSATWSTCWRRSRASSTASGASSSSARPRCR